MIIRHCRADRCLVALACLVFVGHAVLYWDWVEDDAFITLRYAANLVAGEGLVFNPGERVEGYSNLPLVLLEAGALRVGWDPLLVARLLGIFGGVGCLWLAWRLVAALVPGAGRVAVLAPWYLALAPVLPRHAVNGLETVGHAFLVTASFVLAATPGGRVRGWLLPVSLTLLCLSRPEGAAFAVLVASLAHRTRPLPRRAWAAPLVLLAVVMAWRAAYFGSLLPNTFHFKMTGGPAALLPGLHYSLDFLRENGAAALVGLGLLPLVAGRVTPLLLGILGAIALQAAIVVAAGGDWMAHYRFYAPVLPLAASLFAAGVACMRPWLASAPRPRAAVAALAISLAMMSVNVYKTEREVWRLAMPAVRADGYLTQAYARVGRWLQANTPADAVVAISDVGAVGYYSQRRVVDMFGLVDPHIARTPGELHAKHDAAYVLAQRPDVVVLVEGRDAACQPIYFRQSDRALAATAEFSAWYAPVHAVAILFLNETAQIYRRRPAD